MSDGPSPAGPDPLVGNALDNAMRWDTRLMHFLSACFFCYLVRLICCLLGYDAEPEFAA
jgi:hypothetical protein